MGLVASDGYEEKRVVNHSTISGSPTVVKVGGALLAEPAWLAEIWKQVALLQEQGPVVLVHGGGSQATNLARRLGHEPRMVHGRRITTDVDLEIVKAAFGTANIELVASGATSGLKTIGLTGVDARSLKVVRRPPRNVDGELIDFGWVGDVVTYDASALNDLFSLHYVPVVAPLGVDDGGLIYNVNADTVASEIARSIGAVRLLFVTDSGGVRRDVSDAASILGECTSNIFRTGVEEGWINAGMRTKLEVALAAAARTSAAVFIAGFDDLFERSRATRIVAATESESQA